MWNLNAMMMGAASAVMLLSATPALAAPVDAAAPVAAIELAGNDVGSVWMPPRPGSYRDKFCLEDRPCKYRTQIA